MKTTAPCTPCSTPPRAVPAFLKALGRRELPKQIEVDGARFAHAQTFKNDFFAVTAMYAGPDRRVLLKINRQAPLFVFPMRWVGRILARRECTALQRMEGTPGIPRLIARWQDTGFVREYIEGAPLARGNRVSDDFHGQLRELIAAIHARDMAYVDLEKCENVLVGADGRPYLFDFQISWYLSPRWGGNLPPLRVLRRWFQRGDLYHLVKLQRRTRPDQLTPEALAASYRRPWYVRLHRTLTYPFTWCRRRVLDRIDPRRGGLERGRVMEP